MNKSYISSSEKASEFRDCIRWIGAIDAWDYCDGTLLADLFLKEDIPIKLKPVISNIISGSRKQNKKAAASLKVPANERIYIAHDLLLALGLIDEFKTAKTDGKSLVEWGADKNRIEPSQSRKWLEIEAIRIKKETADKYNVSVQTIENLLLDLRNKLKNFPDI